MNILKKLFAQQKNLVPGDIFYTYFDDKYHVYKLLVFDKEFNCYHVLGYEPVSSSQININNLEINIYHMPIDKNGFRDVVFVAHTDVMADDLIGYHEYLRQTQDINDYIPLANHYYQLGLRVTDENKRNKAIDWYSKAIDLIPTFFEAIDNRAFCKMDLGQWQNAIEDFRLSLTVQPNSVLAEFSIGECYLRLGDYISAKQQFEKAHNIAPEEPAPIEFLKKVNELIGNKQKD